jgi:hypothetical protein
MVEIENSSSAISKTIAMIDDIASQTNLLPLSRGRGGAGRGIRAWLRRGRL